MQQFGEKTATNTIAFRTVIGHVCRGLIFFFQELTKSGQYQFEFPQGILNPVGSAKAEGYFVQSINVCQKHSSLTLKAEKYKFFDVSPLMQLFREMVVYNTVAYRIVTRHVCCGI